MNNKLIKSCSLVRFTNLNDKTQEILEMALNYEVIPFSAENDMNAFIFEGSSQEALHSFHDKLNEIGFEMEIEMFYR